MKKIYRNLLFCMTIVSACSLASCEKDDHNHNGDDTENSKWRLPLSKTVTSATYGPEIVQQTTWSYDSQDRATGTTILDNGQKVFDSQITYSTRTTTILSNEYDSENTRVYQSNQTITYADDALTRPLTEKTEEFSPKGEITSTTSAEYTYDAQNRLIGKKSYKGEQLQLTAECKDFVYDGTKCSYKIISYNSDGSIYYTFHWDEVYTDYTQTKRQKVTVTKEYPNGRTATDISTFSYDKKGRWAGEEERTNGNMERTKSNCVYGDKRLSYTTTFHNTYGKPTEETLITFKY